MIKLENCDQLKAFLKKESKRLNISITNVYNTFFSRILLYKISKHYYAKEFVVKGSFAQFVHINKLVRPITDIDITTTDNSYNELMYLFQAINLEATKENDIRYDVNKKAQTYTGINKFGLTANYGKIKHPIGIDYRENHPCIYERQIKPVPTIFTGDEPYNVVVPSIEETLAEKLCIIVESNKEDMINTRVKDFYDIYQLHGGEYDLEKFSFFFEKMIIGRGNIKSIDDLSTSHLSPKFVSEHQEIWEHCKKKYEFLDDEIDLEGSVYYTRAVLSEQLQKVRQGINKTYVYEKNK
ncbi:MAG TPA: nucleotidyl transferase AbiEii/AbiGii toxin family protein [Bacilli bacterium]|nr:nucleotidyl transferase AbiEii/AbiGii toxin family protein [Bacilli bacterium]